MSLRTLWLSSIVLAAAAAAAMPALAQNPAAPLTIVVPYPAGGPLDISARIVAEGTTQLGPITVENKPGAGGNTGADQVAKAGKTSNQVLMGAVATHAVNPWLYKNFPYNPIKDFKPLVLVARTPNVLVVNAENAAKLGIKTTPDLVQYLKKNPNQFKYGSGGNGSIGHIAAEMFESLTNTKMDHTPFQGSKPALAALESGQVLLVFDNLASALPQIQSGKFLALGVTTLSRNEALPNVPSINDSVQGFNVSTWFGLFAPASLPDADARRYATAFAAAMHSPAGKEKFKKMGIAPEELTLDTFAQFVRSENSKYEFLIRAAKIKID
ncbi:ABC transporter substrate-binding protein [Acidovorax sp. Leaf76]|uniref:Bug family tripartite tricarboxylate transporter substrate binding protein n=1 Tax=unclassified Acidovorax TaxID=2684926 RepID=UPI0006F4122E|nr:MULTISPECIES: tripartite tricarboxylate transporter substrate binding protein [unclassified Acidovorax]KQO24007.1 ABC transporter substrate-binding protein [Acidovorax sp. Leaf76]KQO38459.1 ABC transporter substrate-binding protein [Acidovorax sp. Leaf84]KQS40818.1 ABC transporter substrate-binding protein [Acidovorax sp. Leaf191]